MVVLAGAGVGTLSNCPSDVAAANAAVFHPGDEVVVALPGLFSSSQGRAPLPEGDVGVVSRVDEESGDLLVNFSKLEKMQWVSIEDVGRLAHRRLQWPWQQPLHQQQQQHQQQHQQHQHLQRKRRPSSASSLTSTSTPATATPRNSASRPRAAPAAPPAPAVALVGAAGPVGGGPPAWAKELHKDLLGLRREFGTLALRLSKAEPGEPGSGTLLRPADLANGGAGLDEAIRSSVAEAVEAAFATSHPSPALSAEQVEAAAKRGAERAAGLALEAAAGRMVGEAAARAGREAASAAAAAAAAAAERSTARANEGVVERVQRALDRMEAQTAAAASSSNGKAPPKSGGPSDAGLVLERVMERLDGMDSALGREISALETIVRSISERDGAISAASVPAAAPVVAEVDFSAVLEAIHESQRTTCDTVGEALAEFAGPAVESAVAPVLQVVTDYYKVSSAGLQASRQAWQEVGELLGRAERDAASKENLEELGRRLEARLSQDIGSSRFGVDVTDSLDQVRTGVATVAARVQSCSERIDASKATDLESQVRLLEHLGGIAAQSRTGFEACEKKLADVLSATQAAEDRVAKVAAEAARAPCDRLGERLGASLAQIQEQIQRPALDPAVAPGAAGGAAPAGELALYATVLQAICDSCEEIKATLASSSKPAPLKAAAPQRADVDRLAQAISDHNPRPSTSASDSSVGAEGARAPSPRRGVGASGAARGARSPSPRLVPAQLGGGGMVPQSPPLRAQRPREAGGGTEDWLGGKFEDYGGVY